MTDWKKVEHDDPTRCKADIQGGGCYYQAVKHDEGEGRFDYCPRHISHQRRTAKKESYRRYQIERYNQRIDQLKGEDDIKSLRDEIAILRMTLEEVLNSCQSTSDLLMRAGTIERMVLAVDKVVKSCHSIEISTGKLLDGSTVLKIADELVSVVKDTCDEATAAKIAAKIERVLEDGLTSPTTEI